MIVRHYIECDTCGCAHTLRIQVGHELRQEHTFPCTECGEEITIRMDCDQLNGSVAIFELQNCYRGKNEGVIVNLSSEFPIPEQDAHRDLAFPAIQHMKEIGRAQEALGVESPAFSSLAEARNWRAKHHTAQELWIVLKRGWSLTDRGRLQLASEQLAKYGADVDGPPELQYVLFDFCIRMLMPGQILLFESMAKKCSEVAKSNTVNFALFHRNYKTTMHAEARARYFPIFKDYFSYYSDFSQSLVHVQHNIKLAQDSNASSSNFSRTKLFYGNAYEVLTSNVSVLACINNIASGRNFDQFESMTLAKYLTINKANRCNPFHDISKFSHICACLDSTIRNASHHGSMKLSDDGRTIRYRSGGTGMERSMSYLTYLNACNEIMLNCCALLALELTIAF